MFDLLWENTNILRTDNQHIISLSQNQYFFVTIEKTTLI